MNILRKSWKFASTKPKTNSKFDYDTQKKLKALKKEEKESWREKVKEAVMKKRKWQEKIKENERKATDARILAFKRRKRQ